MTGMNPKRAFHCAANDSLMLRYRALDKRLVTTTRCMCRRGMEPGSTMMFWIGVIVQELSRVGGYIEQREVLIRPNREVGAWQCRT